MDLNWQMGLRNSMNPYGGAQQGGATTQPYQNPNAGGPGGNMYQPPGPGPYADPAGDPATGFSPPQTMPGTPQYPVSSDPAPIGPNSPGGTPYVPPTIGAPPVGGNGQPAAPGGLPSWMQWGQGPTQQQTADQARNDSRFQQNNQSYTPNYDPASMAWAQSPGQGGWDAASARMQGQAPGTFAPSGTGGQSDQMMTAGQGMPNYSQPGAWMNGLTGGGGERTSTPWQTGSGSSNQGPPGYAGAPGPTGSYDPYSGGGGGSPNPWQMS